jgi:hypothetical protein
MQRRDLEAVHTRRTGAWLFSRNLSLMMTAGSFQTVRPLQLQFSESQEVVFLSLKAPNPTTMSKQLQAFAMKETTTKPSNGGVHQFRALSLCCPLSKSGYTGSPRENRVLMVCARVPWPSLIPRSASRGVPWLAFSPASEGR